MKNPSVNYINNAEFYSMLTDWKHSNNENMPDNIASAIMNICENLAKSGKFSGYTWKDDMIADAILICVKFAKNFDPEKSKNPFAYFTQIAYNAFRRRINIEHARLATIEHYKHSMDIIYEQDDSEQDYGYIDNNAKSYDQNYQKNYELKKKNKKEKILKEIDALFEE